MISQLQSLEKDLLFFFDYLLFLKKFKTNGNYLDYAGVWVHGCRAIMNVQDDIDYESKYFTEKNCVGSYSLLLSKFDVSDFKDEVFELKDIVKLKNQWRLI